MLAAEFGDPHAPGVVPAALVVELTHLATLYHDDVMDEADLRRGAPSANARWDNSVAILTGDFLFARASDIVADLGPEAVRIQAQTFARLVQGQIRETVGPGDGEDPLAHYLSVVADKTGSLIATSARFGARVAGRRAERRGDADRVRRADRHGLPAVRRHHRRRERHRRLRQDARHRPARRCPDAAVAVRAALDRRDRPPATGLVAGPIDDDAEHAEALSLLRESAGLGLALREVGRRADEARSLLDELPDIPAREALGALCDVVVSRTS